ncbi:hypothetical protein CDAR_524911 [Caerostris darwini]|uniref:Uncharacterized protein n=1 Tax=Caerostris darwini TaxID=1538125 RepID=A0AAV4QYK4_9ARAC|nr:hypothetical protein CDAR_524911 [Caerostris darwini]
MSDLPRMPFGTEPSRPVCVTFPQCTTARCPFRESFLHEWAALHSPPSLPTRLERRLSHFLFKEVTSPDSCFETVQKPLRHTLCHSLQNHNNNLDRKKSILIRKQQRIMRNSNECLDVSGSLNSRHPNSSSNSCNGSTLGQWFLFTQSYPYTALIPRQCTVLSGAQVSPIIKAGKKQKQSRKQATLSAAEAEHEVGGGGEKTKGLTLNASGESRSDARRPHSAAQLERPPPRRFPPDDCDSKVAN